MDGRSVLELSGTVRARFETPVAFQLDGRIETRHINAGQHVAKGQVLFELDTRDLKQSIHATKAEHAAAQAALATATADVGRDRKLLIENFISRQSLERTELWPSERLEPGSMQRKHNCNKRVMPWVMPTCVPKHRVY